MSTPHVHVQPYYIREPQDWAIETERRNHAQALYQVGEWAMFVLMWHVVDFEAGLVTRCSTCYGAPDTRARKIADAYNQPTKNKCPDCFGTTFEGGFRAKIVRPAIFTDTDETERIDRRGAVHPDDLNVETTWDFRALGGDYVIRSDNSRWQIRTPERTTLRTGFEHPEQIDTSISYGNIRAGVEEPGTVAYMIPPVDFATVHSLLTTPMRYPGDFSSVEVIRAPLIPHHPQD